MTEQDVDVVVVGLGPGGEHAAGELARAGIAVVGIESRLVGGECPYYGCVPSKMMIRAADALAEARRVPGLAGSVDVRPDWDPVFARIRDEATDDWDDTVAVRRLEEAGVQFVRGRGRLVGPGCVEATGPDGRTTTYAAGRGVVLNTGTEPDVPPIDGLAGTPYWTNRDAVQQEQLPASLAVIGGGATGAELAQAFARFGVEVTLLDVADRILEPEEPEASAVVADAFVADGIRLLTGASLESIEYADGMFRTLVDGVTVTTERLLVSTGRRNNLADIGLESVGLDGNMQVIETDERMRAGERLWAIGDITGKGAFTHVSMYQAGVVVRDLLGRDGPWADYRAVARVTFTDPEVGSVGITEAQARNQGLNVRTGTADLSASARGWIARADGVVKLVADTDRGVLVGGTAVGPSGGEVLSLLAAAVHAAVPLDTLRGMHFAYPTHHRAIETALEDLG